MSAWSGKPRLIGVAGGSGSGKTTLVTRLRDTCEPGAVVALQLDHYYRDLSALAPAERDRRNFDHPDAFDMDLIQRHLTDLAAGRPIRRPTYDFATHTRSSQDAVVEPAPVMVLDGILTLHWDEVRTLLDLGIFVDVDDDVRLLRRLRRDISERGRTIDSVAMQYLASVKPMHDQYVAPQKFVADIIISWHEYNDRAVAMLAGMVHDWS